MGINLTTIGAQEHSDIIENIPAIKIISRIKNIAVKYCGLTCGAHRRYTLKVSLQLSIPPTRFLVFLKPIVSSIRQACPLRLPLRQ